MGKFIDETNNVHGKLTVIESHPERGKSGEHRWICQCECGNTHITAGNNLRCGKTKSCGCVGSSANITHGWTRQGKQHPLYGTWSAMRGRCYTPTHHAYHNYGGRGITMCDQWYNSFTQFVEDVGERPEGMTLDRIDNNKGYSKDNCRWASRREQCQNTNKSRKARLIDPDGIRIIIKKGYLKQFCEENNLHSGAVSGILNGIKPQYKGWTGTYLE